MMSSAPVGNDSAEIPARAGTGTWLLPALP